MALTQHERRQRINERNRIRRMHTVVEMLIAWPGPKRTAAQQDRLLALSDACWVEIIDLNDEIGLVGA